MNTESKNDIGLRKNECIVWASETIGRDPDKDHVLDHLFGFRVWDFSINRTDKVSRKFKITVEEIFVEE